MMEAELHKGQFVTILSINKTMECLRYAGNQMGAMAPIFLWDGSVLPISFLGGSL